MVANETDQALECVNTPGVVVEVDRKTAEALGAFEEDALTEEEALESAAGFEEGEGAAGAIWPLYSLETPP